MKPPCEIRIFDKLAPASDVSLLEVAQIFLIPKNKNAWVPPHLR